MIKGYIENEADVDANKIMNVDGITGANVESLCGALLAAGYDPDEPLELYRRQRLIIKVYHYKAGEMADPLEYVPGEILCLKVKSIFLGAHPPKRRLTNEA